MSSPATSLSLAITGAGGKGAITAGLILLDAAAHAGRYAYMSRSVGPQIRGGEAAALLRIASAPVDCLDDRLDLLIALDWLNTGRFADELPLSADSLLVCDPKAGPPPAALLAAEPRQLELPLEALAAGLEGGRVNMLAVGIAGSLLGLPQSALEAATHKALDKKGEKVVNDALAALALGRESVTAQGQLASLGESAEGARWNISGNEACGLGALRAGVRFAAAYPITPASEILEWLTPRIERLGGSLIQAEDELAAINMTIGASFGGTPAMTATSGPGLSLMQEGIGLAITSETPLLLVNVNRGGPSTGIPTKSEQSDLNACLYGPHGDAPHLLLAPLSIPDCTTTTAWAAGLAERLQTVAIVLSDQSLGQSRALCDAPAEAPSYPRSVASEGEGYRRYALTDDGVSPCANPGTPGHAYVADGLEHTESGTPSSAASDHTAQMAKRLRKLAQFDYGPLWGEVHGHGELVLLCFGSLAGVVRESAERLRAQGRTVRTVALRLLMPLPIAELQRALDGAIEVVVIEQNQGGQLFRYLRGEGALPSGARSIARPGPLPLRPGALLRALEESHE